MDKTNYSKVSCGANQNLHILQGQVLCKLKLFGEAKQSGRNQFVVSILLSKKELCQVAKCNDYRALDYQFRERCHFILNSYDHGEILLLKEKITSMKEEFSKKDGDQKSFWFLYSTYIPCNNLRRGGLGCAQELVEYFKCTDNCSLIVGYRTIFIKDCNMKTLENKRKAKENEIKSISILQIPGIYLYKMTFDKFTFLG